MPATCGHVALGLLVTVVAYLLVASPSISTTPAEPVLWTGPDRPAELPTFSGGYAADASRGAMLSDGGAQQALKIVAVAPESTAVGSARKGEVYASMGDGSLSVLNADASKIVPLLHVGVYVRERDMSAQEKDTEEHRQWRSKFTDWCAWLARTHEQYSVENERLCGRPLGVRFVSTGPATGQVWFMDSMYGLFRLDVKHSESKNSQTASADDAFHFVPEVERVEHVLDTSTGLTPQPLGGARSAAADPVAALPLMFPNDLDLVINPETGEVTTVYMTDSSYKFTRAENRQEIIDGAPRGRVLRYDVSSKRLDTVLCGLHFANGIQLMDGGSKLLVAEGTRFRIQEISIPKLQSAPELFGDALASCSENNIHWPEQGVRTFADNMPGIPDNIRADTDGAHLLVGFATKRVKPFSLLDFAYDTTTFRKILMSITPVSLLADLVPKYGLVGRLNMDGQAVESFHDPTGKSAFMISQATRHPKTGDLWLGSHSNEFMGIVRATHLNRQQR